MIFQIISYIKFLLKSTNQHGVHSPFVYNLVTKCFYIKTYTQKSNLSNKYINKLRNNNTTISVTDFGKGSQVFKSNERKVSKIAKVAGMSRKKAALMIRLVEYFKPKKILEIGTSLGIGTYNMHLGNENATIKSLEGCKETAKIAISELKDLKAKNIDIEIGDFKTTLPKSLNNNNFDLIYFDGNHQKKATLDYFNQCLKAINNETVFIFDDIHWSKEMKEAWNIIKNHPKVTVSIDIFFWGIIFFRKEQVKEHFTIRV